MLLVLRVLISLGVVLGLFWMVARTGSRKLGGRDRGLVRVRSRQALSRGSSLAVVEVGSRVLVVGVSDGGVRLLTEMDPAELESAAPAEVVEAAPVVHAVADLDPAVEPAWEAEPVATAAYAGAGTEQPFQAYLAAEVSDMVAAAERGQPVSEALSQPVAQPVSRPAARPAAARSQGALAGSLLSGSTWRQAWGTATGRAYRSDDGDAA